MQYQKDQKNQQTYPARTLHDERERNRILMQYGGIFKHAIPEFASTVLAKQRKLRNYSR